MAYNKEPVEKLLVDELKEREFQNNRKTLYRKGYVIKDSKLVLTPENIDKEGIVRVSTEKHGEGYEEHMILLLGFSESWTDPRVVFSNKAKQAKFDKVCKKHAVGQTPTAYIIKRGEELETLKELKSEGFKGIFLNKACLFYMLWI